MKQVIVVRTDLGMEPGRAAVQIAHAAVSAVANNFEHADVQEWLEKHFTKIVLKVDSEAELLNLQNKAQKAGLVYGLMEETELPGHEGKVPTALAIGPANRFEINQITGRLPKW